MDLSVNFGNLKPAKVVQDDVTELITASFERFRSYIRCVSVTVTDINGPRGGVDKQCRCVLQLKRMAPIVIEDRDESFFSLLTRVSNRAAHTLSQRIDRKQTSYRSRKRISREDNEPAVNEIADRATSEPELLN